MSQFAKPKTPRRDYDEEDDEDELRQRFEEYCAFGTSHSNGLTSKNLIKMARDSGLFDKQVTTTTLDLIFTREAKGGKRLTWQQFQQVVMAIARLKNVDVATLKIERPKVTLTPEPVRFHDDKATYTGTHRSGGPRTEPAISLSDLADRSDADIRGVKFSRKYDDLLTRYFLKHNPAKASNVPALLTQYAGKEHVLFAKMEQKYGYPVDGSAVRPTDIPTPTPGQQQQQDEPRRSIYDKLTDTSLYTGAHRQRFDRAGQGRGLAGRDYVAKGNGVAPRLTGSTFDGNTNARTDTTFYDSSQFLMR